MELLVVPAKRIVKSLPLSELWDQHGALPYKRRRTLSAIDIKQRLRAGQHLFVAADVGQPLMWIEPSASFQFWKEEVKPRLVDPASAQSGFILEIFPGNYAYVATEWLGQDASVVVLLERYH